MTRHRDRSPQQVGDELRQIGKRLHEIVHEVALYGSEVTVGMIAVLCMGVEDVARLVAPPPLRRTTKRRPKRVRRERIRRPSRRDEQVLSQIVRPER